jgi:hypothetical protein
MASLADTRGSQAPATTTARASTEVSPWFVRLGIAATVAWFGIATAYVHAELGWTRFQHLPADTLGSFLEGVFAPLAFLWLVIGYFLQQAEIHQNTEALRAQAVEIQRTAEQAIIQSEAIAANEVHARQETFLRIADQVKSQLGTIVGMLWVSSQGATGNGSVSAHEQSRMFTQLSANDTEVFARRMIETHFNTDPAERFALFYGTPVRARHSNHYVVTFERLVARARDCDPEGLIVGALSYSAHGLVHDLASGYRRQAPAELADPEPTGTYVTVRPTPPAAATTSGA